MKKTRYLAILVALCLILSGCGNAEKPSDENPAQPSQSQSQVQSPSAESTPPESQVSPEKQYSQGVTDTTIKIGSTGPQTGPVAALGAITRGMNAYFHYINDNGGINGRQIEFIMYDDGYQPENTVASMKRLVEEDKVFAVCGSIGTAGINAVKDYVIEEGMPMVSLATGASTFTDPVIPTFFSAALNYALESAAMTQYAYDNLGAKKIGVFYQNDDFGKDYLAGINKRAEKLGIEVAVTMPYDTTELDFAPAALAMKSGEVDVILIAAMKQQAAAFALELEKLGVNAQLLANNSAGNDAAMMKDLAGSAWEGAIVSSDYIPPTKDDNSPEIVAFKEYTRQYCPTDNETSPACLSGWQCGEILVEALRNCGDNLTWDNLIAELEKLDNWSGDYAQFISYSPTDHRGTRGNCFLEARDGVNVPITEHSRIQE